MVTSPDDQWVYVGDAEGKITAVHVSLWDAEFGVHLNPEGDYTGGCLHPLHGYTIPCPPALDLGSEISQMLVLP